MIHITAPTEKHAEILESIDEMAEHDDPPVEPDDVVVTTPDIGVTDTDAVAVALADRLDGVEYVGADE